MRERRGPLGPWLEVEMEVQLQTWQLIVRPSPHSLHYAPQGPKARAHMVVLKVDVDFVLEAVLWRTLDHGRCRREILPAHTANPQIHTLPYITLTR